MKKTILVTGSTDGIGLATARMLLSMGHTVLLHGRSASKLNKVASMLSETATDGQIEIYVADLSRLDDVEAMAQAVMAKHAQLDVLINNAGVYVVPTVTSQDGLDIRFAVNTIAPYLLTKRLLPLMKSGSRVVNLSSAAQYPLNPQALTGPSNSSDGEVYAQSKLALTMWSRHMADTLKGDGPAIIAVNPKSMLASKMVKQAYGVNGHDLNIGAEVLCNAALADEFADASGKYYDNDIGRFAPPHPDALDQQKNAQIVRVMESILADFA